MTRLSWVLVDLDHGGLDLAVSREKLEIYNAAGNADVRGAVGAKPGKCGLDLRTANTEVLVGVVCCSADLRGELHDLDVGSKAGQHVGELVDVGGPIEEAHMPGEDTAATFHELPGRYGDLDATDECMLGIGEVPELWGGRQG